jgi:TusA-related sulfurtransferase
MDKAGPKPGRHDLRGHDGRKSQRWRRGRRPDRKARLDPYGDKFAQLRAPVCDLTDEVWPVCLLKFKGELDRVPSGGLLEVVVADTDVIDSVAEILRHAAGRILRINKGADDYRILIQREASSNDAGQP